MAKRSSAKSTGNGTGANLGFEATLWAAADMNAVSYATTDAVRWSLSKGQTLVSKALVFGALICEMSF